MWGPGICILNKLPGESNVNQVQKTADLKNVRFFLTGQRYFKSSSMKFIYQLLICSFVFFPHVFTEYILSAAGGM